MTKTRNKARAISAALTGRRDGIRTLAIACFTVVLLTASAGFGRAADASTQAGEFLVDMTNQAIAQLTDESLPLAERKTRFRELFRANFDVPAVGRFVLGRYWRTADAETREAFLSVFEEVMVQRFAPKFAGYAETKFEVSKVRALEDESQYVVSSKISPKTGEPFEVGWRVRQSDGQFKILDVIGEGVSMALTLRSEYASAIKDSGGQIQGLIDRLRKQVESETDTQTSKKPAE